MFSETDQSTDHMDSFANSWTDESRSRFVTLGIEIRGSTGCSKNGRRKREGSSWLAALKNRWE